MRCFMTIQLSTGLGTFTACLFLRTAVAVAQPSGETAGSAPPSQAPSGTPSQPNASASNAAGTATPETPAAPGTCRLGKHSGVDPNDAETAASLVCRELPNDAMTSGHAYRVDLDKLGTRIFVSFVAEANGKTVDSRRIGLDRIEEVPTVAPRLTDALVHNRSMQDTEQLGNLSWAEAEAPARKRGRLLTSLGVLGAGTPGVSAIAPGILGSVVYDTPRWALTVHGQLAFGVGSGERFNTAALGIGPRYMLSTGNSSLFFGGGMAIESLGKVTQVTDSSGYRIKHDSSNGGIAAYAEIGYEAMRLHRNRLNVALRADFPLFQVDGAYLVPLTLSTSFVFDGF